MSAPTPAAREGPEPTSAAAPPLVEKTWVYRVGLVFCWLLTRVWHRARIRGREHLPAGGFLLVANHQSFSDIPALGVTLWRHAAFVYRDSLRASRFLAWFTDRCGAIPIQRGAADRAALRAMQEHLAAGDCVVVFPEGTRSADGRMAPFRGGVLVAARKAGVPLVPAAIRGGCQAWPRTRTLPRPRRMSVEVGPPIDPSAPDALERLQAAIAGRVGDGRFGGGPAERAGGAEGAGSGIDIRSAGL